jgi:hypothetical protein
MLPETYDSAPTLVSSKNLIKNDRSVVSVLSSRYGLPRGRDGSRFSDTPKDKHRQMVNRSATHPRISYMRSAEVQWRLCPISRDATLIATNSIFSHLLLRASAVFYLITVD